MNGMDLKVKRIIKGIQLQQIARLLGVSNAFVTYMENGKRNIPTDKYEKWVTYLNDK